MSFVPLHNPIGFGAVDFIELFIAFFLVVLALSWRPFIAPAAARLSRRPVSGSTCCCWALCRLCSV